MIRILRSAALTLLALIAVVALAEAQSTGVADQEIQRFTLPGSNTTGWRIHTDGVRVWLTFPVGAIKFTGATHATLGSYDLGPGTLIYCTDCTKASPCASGGAGAWAKRRSSGSGAGASGGFDCD